MSDTITILIDDLFDAVSRLEAKRNAPPQPLSRLADRPRDGPREGHGPLPAPRRDHGAHSAAPANPAGISYRSRKVLP